MDGFETSWRVLLSGIKVVQSLKVPKVAELHYTEKATIITKRLCEEEKKSALRKKIAKILMAAPGTFAKLNAVKSKYSLSFYFFCSY
jgi:hypothetical protein